MYNYISNTRLTLRHLLSPPPPNQNHVSIPDHIHTYYYVIHLIIDIHNYIHDIIIIDQTGSNLC